MTVAERTCTALLPCGCEVDTTPGAPPPTCSRHQGDVTPDHVRARQGRR